MDANVVLTNDEVIGAATGYYLDGTSAKACTAQLGCTTTTAGTCSTSAGITSKLPCTEADAGYELDGDKVKALPVAPGASDGGGSVYIIVVACVLGAALAVSTFDKSNANIPF